MGASSFTFIPSGDGAAAGWAITLVLTFLLVGLPTIYLLVMILASDDDAFDRAGSDIQERMEVKRRAQGLAWGRDVDAGLEQPAAGRRPVVVAEATISSRGGRR
jgi:hypothetical protein